MAFIFFGKRDASESLKKTTLFVFESWTSALTRGEVAEWFKAAGC